MLGCRRRKVCIQEFFRNCFLSPVATDGMDENGLNFENIGQFFQGLMLRVPKILKKLIMVSPFR